MVFSVRCLTLGLVALAVLSSYVFWSRLSSCKNETNLFIATHHVRSSSPSPSTVCDMKNSSESDLLKKALARYPSCSFEVQDISGNVQHMGQRTSATLFTGWTPLTKNMELSSFLESPLGSFTQYVKGAGVQPLQDKNGTFCTAPGAALTRVMMEQARRSKKQLLFFTNDKENPQFSKALSQYYSVPSFLNHVLSFKVFSAMIQGGSHPFHKHGEAWLGQVVGSRLWYVLPPQSRPPSEKANACAYLKGEAVLPDGAQACVQLPGQVVHLPKGWMHATCALQEWNVGVGAQNGDLKSYNQAFPKLKANDKAEVNEEDKFRAKMVECGALPPDASDGEAKHCQLLTPSATIAPHRLPGWSWFGGDLKTYYNKLTEDERRKRNPSDLATYAVHRWMGRKRSTLVHYELVHESIKDGLKWNQADLRVFDAGCGLGAGLMWFEKREPTWNLVGHTVSEEQYTWIMNDLPPHRFKVALESYDKPPVVGRLFDVFYSLEAAIHSPDLSHTLRMWSSRLREGGLVVIIDDFLAPGIRKDDNDVVLFASSWMATSLASVDDVVRFANAAGMDLINDRDLVNEFEIIRLNYKKQTPSLDAEGGKTHQGWLGAKVRQKLTVQGKIHYRMLVLRKRGDSDDTHRVARIPPTSKSNSCAVVPFVSNSGNTWNGSIQPVLRTGVGQHGGKEMACISSWYCCDKGAEIMDKLKGSRTDRTPFLKLPETLFGHYLDVFAKHLTEFYRTYPAIRPSGAEGVFLDIGGTGSVASGMRQVTSKFAHFAGPLQYWVLDSDGAAKGLSNAIVCDIDNCSAARDCAYDVTFSHTVLEHAAEPWKAFDTVARITKRGGISLHLVPWSYEYHATPDDYFRFSHRALQTLFENRGFETLQVGYDICTKPRAMRSRVDEHYDAIWLTYIVARKL
eukprot:TRINITY_DN26951_c0_g1_i1.p1 TRINITY_DN26951_c0_g1~~TRINITY_DN26951_c0_g1_i1.p1  ORF type:complete len:909 (-),score=81.97 TRINITY_DN26951_c0_g1_i1:175-2901(-)